MERSHFYHFAPEFADIEHLQPALAVVSPFVNRPDGSFLQLEYRGGDVIPYAVARYHLPDAALNGVILHGSPADDLQLDERDTLCPECGKPECTCQEDWANSINDAVNGGRS